MKYVTGCEGCETRLVCPRHGMQVKPSVADTYVGRHVTHEHEGRTLLGTVVGYSPGANGVTFLLVNFFNGEPWPVDPMLSLVTFLERTFETVEEE